MVLQKQESFALDNFEGPLDFLLHLIQREEIDIYDVPIHHLTQQFISKLSAWQDRQVERGAEFIGVAAYLVWLKSKTLLPKHEQTVDLQPEEEDPHFEIIHHLLDYCRFKQEAKELIKRQEQQSACFYRGLPGNYEWKKPMGIDHLSLEELSILFKEMISRVPPPKPQIQEENWRVSDKIRSVRAKIQEQPHFPLEELFDPNKSRLELIVIFLAILELMKNGEIGIIRREESILVIAK